MHDEMINTGLPRVGTWHRIDPEQQEYALEIACPQCGRRQVTKTEGAGWLYPRMPECEHFTLAPHVRIVGPLHSPG